MYAKGDGYLHLDPEIQRYHEVMPHAEKGLAAFIDNLIMPIEKGKPLL